ncbi:MAG: glycosyltransferase family 2 protein [Verrucomicrobia bacterium]|nr:glycosyltransferase family 2 protein [Verrucomicrobiota bacterium]
MPKLIIQIPCLNEEQTLPQTLRDLPRSIRGVDVIEWLIVNDGSTDRTVEVARAAGVQHILDLGHQTGLANAFRSGLAYALEAGADIIVNTDGDNQYCGADIEKLVHPILDGEADIVVGCRDIEAIKHFSPLKKLLQRVGSCVVRGLSRTDVKDTTSGFRAYSRQAALKLNVFSTYTYTLETIIQAGRNNMRIAQVPVRTNPKLRESRLMRNMVTYIARQSANMLRIYLLYEPLKTFLWAGTIALLPGMALMIRFLHSHFTRVQGGRIQSLIIATVFLLIALGCFLLGLLGDVLAKSRMLSEDILFRLRDHDLRDKEQQRREP